MSFDFVLDPCICNRFQLNGLLQKAIQIFTSRTAVGSFTQVSSSKSKLCSPQLRLGPSLSNSILKVKVPGQYYVPFQTNQTQICGYFLLCLLAFVLSCSVLFD